MVLNKLRPSHTVLVLVFIAILAGCDSGSSSSSSNDCTATGSYSVGDVGPGGGLIFYVDEDDVHADFTYLEAAPQDLETGDGSYEWAGLYSGTAHFIGAISEGVGTGAGNTEKVVAYLDQAEQTRRAAQRAAAYEINGCDDWFLPSKDELNWMHVNLYQEGLGDFDDAFSTWWSSTEANDQQAWAQDFPTGSQTAWLKTFRERVRPARSF